MKSGRNWGRLGMKFETVTFEEITINYDKKRVPLSTKQRESIKGDYRYYGAQGVIDYIDDYIFDGKYLLIAEDGENLKSKKQNIAQLAEGKFWVNNHAHIVQCNSKCRIEYLCYLINSMDLSGYITGSAQPKLSQANINKISFRIPIIEQQDLILSVLIPIEKKINLNNRMNENLEQQAQAIFKSWFVDFEPFGGVMPEDWRTGSLSEICGYSKDKVNIEDLTLDTYYSTENMQPNRQGAVQATALPTIKQTIACKKGDVLISNIRPYFKKIIYCFADCGCSTDVLCFVPNKSEYSAFLYCALYSDKFFDYMVAGSKGTKMPRGDKQQIMMYPICIPSTEYVEQFSKIVAPMLETVYTNRLEANDLAILRDTLLPKLMKGEIDVSEVKI